MSAHEREKGISRRSWLLAGLALPLFRARAADFSVMYDGDTLRPIAPSLHFLTGKPLDSLKDANAVVFVSRLSLYGLGQSVPLRQAPQRFVVSYDIWEERFKVAIPGPSARSRQGLAAAQAEAWCLENMAVSTLGLDPASPFYLQLELRAAETTELSAVFADPGISLRAFVELFSRKAGPGEPHWGPFNSGLLRLADMVRTQGRGARTG